MNLRIPLLCLAAFLAGSAVRGEPARFTLAGSSTVTRVLMPIKAGVEVARGVEIRLVPIGSGRGLAELLAGHADAAMLSGPIDYLLERLGGGNPGGPTADQFEKLKLAESPKGEVVALLHPANPVRSLTREQVRGILGGELANWSEVGGPDLPVVLILPDDLDGVRATLAVDVMAGGTFSASARAVGRTADIIPAVAAEPGAVGLIPRGTLPADAVCAEIEPRMRVSLYIVALRGRLEEDTSLEMTLNSLHSRAR